MLNLKEGIKNVDICKNIIYESEAFIANYILDCINNISYSILPFHLYIFAFL